MKYKEKCDICGSWTTAYISFCDHIFCEKCFYETHGKLELSNPQQLGIDDFLSKGSERSE